MNSSLASRLACCLWVAAVTPALTAQTPDSEVAALAGRLTAMTAVTGYEQRVVDTLLALLPGGSRDRAGNAVAVLGRGAGRRLVVCPLDEPGYVVGGLRADGYLTLRRVPGRVSPAYDQQLQGHRVAIMGRKGAVPGVVAVRSIHLTRGRGAPAEIPFTVDSAYVDVGAASRSEAARLGIAVLSPVTLAKRPHRYGTGLLAGPSAGRRSACAALVAAARGAAAQRAVVVAFAVEQELSERGLATLANAAGPFAETVVVDGRPGGFGEVVRSEDGELASRWPPLGKVARWSLGVRYGGTPVESVSLRDVEQLRAALVAWIGGPR